MIKIKQLIFLSFFLVFLNSCIKNEDTELAQIAPPVSSIVVTTNAISSITSASAIASGSIMNEGIPIIASGICYSKNPNPTIAGSNNTVVANSSDSSYFSVNITGLQINTTYYVRAYATIGSGTAYGNQQVFTTALAIGQTYEGGILFYLDNTGQHGLIVTAMDQDTAIWGCMGTSINAATGTAIYTGASNTASIVGVNGCSTAGIAARVCTALTSNGYSDWFLPSEDELLQLYQQRRAVGGFSNSYYWSSTQTDIHTAFALNLTMGSEEGPRNKNTFANVRAVRSF